MNEKTKKIIDIATKVVSWVVVAFTIFMVIFTIFTVSTVNKNERSIFGNRFYIVKTDSMSKSENNADMDVHFNAGDIIIIKNLKDARTLEKGDIIAFLSTNSDSYGETVTHMIYEVNYNANGKVIGYTTYGTNTGAIDGAMVEPEYVLGKYVGKLPIVGRFFAFMKTVPGYIVCILVPFLLIIIYNGANVIRLFKRYKGEQNAALQAERDQIAADRAQNEEMMKELLALKQQLAMQSQNTAPAQETAPATEAAAEPIKEQTPVESEPASEVSNADEQPAADANDNPEA